MEDVVRKKEKDGEKEKDLRAKLQSKKYCYWALQYIGNISAIK